MLANAGSDLYVPPGSLTQMNAGAVGPTGAEPYSNMQPYLTLSFCIALVGIYPSRD